MTTTGRTTRQIMIALAAAIFPATAMAGSFAVMSYNVRGLPPEVIEDRTDQIAAIAPLLEDFHTADAPYVGIDSVVGLQELFDQDYYDVLTDPQTVSYAFVTTKDTGGPSSIGDGLNMLSDFSLADFARTDWDECFGTLGQFGSDCDTNKGYSFAQVALEQGVFVDVYTLHADAGQDTGSRAARRDNITQLVDAIVAGSPEGNAVIVFGDTNSLYTKVGDDNIQDLLAGTGVTDVWVQLRRSGVVPTAGPDIEADCLTTPSTGDCELVDKIFYRDGDQLALAPQSYEALKDMFSDEQGDDLSDHYPVAVTFDYAVVTTTTTTSTSTSSTSSTSTSTTTTTLAQRPCGDPIPESSADAQVEGDVATADTRQVFASDALFVLKAAVHSVECAACVCDVDSNTMINATDALRVLKKAVGQNVTLTCPACS